MRPGFGLKALAERRRGGRRAGRRDVPYVHAILLRTAWRLPARRRRRRYGAGPRFRRL